MDRYITTAEVSERLSISDDKVQRLVSDGSLDGYKFGRSLRISLACVERYLQRCRLIKA